MHCTITIEETPDGKLCIHGNIPAEAEKTVAGALTKKLLEGAQFIMNTTLGKNKSFEIGTSN